VCVMRMVIESVECDGAYRLRAVPSEIENQLKFGSLDKRNNS
jgi:hypothetical protein